MANETNIQAHIDNRHRELMEFISDSKADTNDWRKMHDLRQDAIIKNQNEQSIAVVKINEQMRYYNNEQVELKQENLVLKQDLKDVKEELKQIKAKLDTMGRYTINEILAYAISIVTFITGVIGLYFGWKSNK
jgi:hypothetical protein